MPISWNFQFFDQVESTQDKVRTLLHEGNVIVAREQSAGRGRHGREWVSQKGNLFLSFVLKPDCEAQYYGQIALRVGLALGQAVARFVDGDVMLKWPNDVLIDGRKCAGILIEVEGEHLIVGLGVNVASAPEGAARLRGSADEVREVFFEQFDAVYELEFEAVREAWLALAHPVGTKVSVKIGERVREGVFEGVDEFGSMMLDGDVVSSGDVILCS